MTMKKYFFIFYFFISLFFFNIFAEDIYPPDIKKIIDSKKIRVALYPGDIIPFFVHKPQLEGFDISLIRQIADTLGVELEIVSDSESFEGMINLVAEGKADIAVSELSITLERAKKVNFTTPYLVLNQGLLLNRAESQKRKFNQLIPELNQKDIKIAYLKNSSYVLYTKQLFGKADLVGYNSWEEIVKAVEKKEVLAGLVDETTLKIFVIQYPEKVLEIKTVEIVDLKDPVGIAVSPQCPNLLIWLNTLIEIKDVKTSLQEIIKKYLYLIKQEKK